MDFLVNLDVWDFNGLCKNTNYWTGNTGDFFYSGEGLYRISHTFGVSWEQKKRAPMRDRFSWKSLLRF